MLSVPWASGEQAGLDLRDDVLAIEAEAAAAERAAIRAAVEGYLGTDWSVGGQSGYDHGAFGRGQVLAILDAREP